MKINDIPIEELELMSYTDLTYMLLKEKKKPMNTPTLFREICNLLDYSDSDYTSKIGDYYTSLNIDKRFVLLENNEWDIRDNHSVKLEIDDDEESEETEELEEEVDEIVDEDIDDDIKKLTIVSDDELEE